MERLIAAILTATMLYTADMSPGDYPDNPIDPISGVIAITWSSPSYWRDDLPSIRDFTGWFPQIYYIRPDDSLWVRSLNTFAQTTSISAPFGGEREEWYEWYERFYERYGLSSTDYMHEMVLENVAYVTSNDFSAFALQNDGTLWAWGTPVHGMLGLGDIDDWSVYQPRKVMDNVVSVYAGRNLSIYAITADGVLWGWGGGLFPGTLGDGTDEVRNQPVHIMDDVSNVILGNFHAMAITNNSELWSWGNNEFGQLGDGTTEDRLSPVKIMENVRSAGVVNRPRFDLTNAARNYSFAITNDGDLWAWGMNEGQIGDGTMEDRLYPVRILDNVRHAESFDFLRNVNSFAMREDGSLWAWGQNDITEYPSRNIADGSLPVKIKRDAASLWQVHGTGLLVIDGFGRIWSSGISSGSTAQPPDFVRYYFTRLERFERDFEISPFVYMADSVDPLFLGADGSFWRYSREILPAGSVRVQ